MEFLSQLLTDYTLRTVALGAGVLGVISGVLGVYAVLRRQSLLGDAVSHAALPGIGVAFLLYGGKSTLVFMVGAAIAGLLGTLTVLAVTRNTRIKEDSALGIVLAVFFGVGLVLLTYIQKQPGANQAGLDRYLFGQAAAVVMEDVVIMAALGGAALLVLAGLWKEFKLISFDPDFARSLGLPVSVLEVVLSSLIVVAIVIGLQTVGVILMSALLVAPALAARQWTDRLIVMILAAGAFGLLAGVSGATLSSTRSQLPTGPIIVLSVTAIAVFSLAFGARRGAVVAWFRRRRDGQRIAVDALVMDLYELAAQHDNSSHGHSAHVLRAMSTRPHTVLRSLETLREKGWAVTLPGGDWALSSEGLAEGQRRWNEARGGDQP